MFFSDMGSYSARMNDGLEPFSWTSLHEFVHVSLFSSNVQGFYFLRPPWWWVENDGFKTQNT